MMLVISFKATIDFALNREDLREQVQEYLRELVE